ncbi:MAG: hypothetical protein KC414_06525 [Romboutsia sp.]|nr:hypothetical protein [Romboutsia sp.]
MNCERDVYFEKTYIGCQGCTDELVKKLRELDFETTDTQKCSFIVILEEQIYDPMIGEYYDANTLFEVEKIDLDLVQEYTSVFDDKYETEACYEYVDHVEKKEFDDSLSLREQVYPSFYN